MTFMPEWASRQATNQQNYGMANAQLGNQQARQFGGAMGGGAQGQQRQLGNLMYQPQQMGNQQSRPQGGIMGGPMQMAQQQYGQQMANRQAQFGGVMGGPMQMAQQQYGQQRPQMGGMIGNMQNMGRQMRGNPYGGGFFGGSPPMGPPMGFQQSPYGFSAFGPPQMGYGGGYNMFQPQFRRF